MVVVARAAAAVAAAVVAAVVTALPVAVAAENFVRKTFVAR